MAGLFLLTPAQMRRSEPYFPLSHGRPRVDDRRVLSGIATRAPPIALACSEVELFVTEAIGGLSANSSPTTP